jgi:hypothetical protein
MHPDRFCKNLLQFKLLLKAHICNLSPNQTLNLENFYCMKNPYLLLPISQNYNIQGIVYA